MIQLVET